MADTDSSTLPEDVTTTKAEKHKKKKNKKHKKKNAHREDHGDCSVDIDGEHGKATEHAAAALGDPVRDDKKKGKDKKRKRSVESSPDDDGSSSSDAKEKRKKHKKKHKKAKRKERHESSADQKTKQEMDEKIVSSSAIEFYPKPLKSALGIADQPTKKTTAHSNGITDTSSSPITDKVITITLLLFYQYVEPPWDEAQFQNALSFPEEKHNLTGRMRVAREGLNCTLTGSPEGIRQWCADLRGFDGGRGKIDPDTGEKVTEFARTEFKLTDDLPLKQKFPKLHAFEVVELVNYGLAGKRAPEIAKHGGTHLEPEDYHRKMCEKDTVIIDVRNHYEANIGRFDPPEGGAKMIDPMMRKSTEFPVWLDKKETKEMLRGNRC
eukprot:CCRYP_017941-RC/>CCRYP_017941-RC protein AED:0.12 eAED:0.12 QI:0/0.66/0.5/1/0.66/0.5/4/1216/378